MAPVMSIPTSTTVTGCGIPLPLPLLEGLSHRPGAADAIVAEALERFSAGSRIASWLVNVVRRRESFHRQQDPQDFVTNVNSKGGRQSLKRKAKGAGSAEGCTGTLPRSRSKSNQGGRKRRKVVDGRSQRIESMSIKTLTAVTPIDVSRGDLSDKGGVKRSVSCSHHWLVQGLLSCSLSERQISCRILAQGCSLEEHRQWQVVELLVTLLDHSVGDKFGHGTAAVVTPDIVAIGIGWIALLKHIVIRSSVVSESESSSGTASTTNVSTGTSSDVNTGNKSRFALAYAIHRRYGLRWLCSTIWNLVLQLQQPNPLSQSPTRHQNESTSQAPTSPQHQQQYQSGVGRASAMSLARATAIQNLTLALIDFVHCLTLSANGGESDQDCRDKSSLLRASHKHLWSAPAMATKRSSSSKTTSVAKTQHPSNMPLSPLACLVGAYQLLKQQKDPCAVKTRSTDACISMLQRLVDPAATPKVTKRTGQSHSESEEGAATGDDSQKRQPNERSANRLISTFSSTTGNSASSSRPAEATTSPRSTSNPALAAEGANLAERQAAAAVAQIFSAVYGSEEKDDAGDSDDEEGDVAVEDDDEDMEEEEEDDEQEANNSGAAAETVEHRLHDEDEEDEDDDEEIDSDEVDDDDIVDDDDLVIHHDDVARLEEGLLELNEDNETDVVNLAGDDGHASPATTGGAAAGPSSGTNANSTTGPGSHHSKSVQDRKRAYIRASMEVLSLQHPVIRVPTLPKPLPLTSEQGLMTSIMNIVKPPKKPVNTKIILRRAPTQEEFFRGSLSKNPVSLSMLKSTASRSSSSRGHDTTYEPTVRDLRQHIAADLQMADSAEMLELLVANKIIDMDLKLRVVHQVLWKTHLMENSTSTTLSNFLSGGGGATASSIVSRGGAPSFFSTGTGLSMIFSSSFGESGDRSRSRDSSGGGNPLRSSSGNIEAPLSALPPMVVTYRLTGVDGEATEDTVTTLADPEAPSDGANSPEEMERLMEKEYGLTRLVTSLPSPSHATAAEKQNSPESNGRGVSVLLRSVERHITDTLRRIRRDDIGLVKSISRVSSMSSSRCTKSQNPSRQRFKQSPPYPGLTLLWCCAKLPSNRKLLLEARAPTVLLRLLLDVLHSLERQGTSLHSESESVSNPTAKVLQELIEVLASDISSTAGDSGASTSRMDVDGEVDEQETDDQGASTLRLLLSSIETTSLSRPLRNVIAKLLPYLTYGQIALSKELAMDFVRHVSVDYLDDIDGSKKSDEALVVRLSTAASASASNVSGKASATTTVTAPVLMDTFVHASISLPPNEVCNSLRSALLECKFIENIVRFLLLSLPLEPPPWSASLWSSDEQAGLEDNDDGSKSKRRLQLEKEWRAYINRPGLRTALDMLIGLSRNHAPTQRYLAAYKTIEGGEPSEAGSSFLRACHWFEATSDHANSGIYMNRLGLVSETLLDELDASSDTSGVASHVRTVRRKTRERKREIALARRNKALNKMNSFGPLGGQAVGPANSAKDGSSSNNRGSTVRETAASILAPVLGLFQNSTSSSAADSAEAAASTGQAAKRRRTKGPEADNSPAKPAWMAEMESMEDETGLTCAVCQEGRTLQPSELLGLYAYVKKVSVPSSQCGGRSNIDGTALLTALPSSLPHSLAGSHTATEWYPAGKAAGDELKDSSRGSTSSSSSSSVARRATYFTTTVSAGNSIHFSCHTKARQADRSHPKAPKSEWEGASLRNSRVNCNVILPLVSSRSSKVPLVAVDGALTDHQTAVSNLLGARPKSMLWTVLHDVRFLLLRMAYGEALNADCGGGSLASNAQLVFYQMLMADMFEKDAQVDAPETAQHARGLSAGFLAACSILKADGDDVKSSSGGRKSSVSNTALLRGVADSAPMAALTCILFHNMTADLNSAASASLSLTGDEDQEKQDPHPKRRWTLGKESFLRGLLKSAGRRHALGVDTSGCIAGRGSSSGGRSRVNRSSAFADWEVVDDELPPPSETSSASALSSTTSRGSKPSKNSLKPCINDFRDALRPMIVYYAMMDQLSAEFVLNMDDCKVEESANKLVEVLESCQRATSIHELLRKANVTMDHDDIIDELQKGMIAA